MEKESHLNIYLIRGLSRESGHWGDFTTLLEEYFPKVSIHLLDLPGTGKYYRFRSPRSISKIVHFLRSKHEPDHDQTNVIVSSSLGGMVAMDWVINYPEDFTGIVTMNSSFKSICSLNERIKPSIRMLLLKVILSRNIINREKNILKINSNRILDKNKIFYEWIEIQKLRKVTRKNMFFQAIAGFKYRPVKTKLSIPLLILGSKKDKMVCESCILKTHEVFGGELIWHNSAGHCLPLDEPKWVSEQIKTWYDRKILML